MSANEKIMRAKTGKILSITKDWHLSKVQQVADTVKKEIVNGGLKKDDQLPSINDFSRTYSVARDTVEKAYQILKDERYIVSVKGRGYFVKGVPAKKLRVLLVMNKISAYKKIVYNSFVKALGDKAVVDLQIHHYRLDILKDIVESRMNQYDHFVIMPHFTHDTDPRKVLALLRSIPSGKLTILDKRITGLDNPAEVYQDFENDIYEALMSQSELIDKYNNLVVILRSDEFHPREIIKGIRRFCRKHKKGFMVASGAEELELQPATLYIETSESDLAYLMKKAKELRFRLAKDIGIISFNETVLKDLLQVTVVTTNFEKMGVAAAVSLLNKHPQRIKVPFDFIKRKTV